MPQFQLVVGREPLRSCGYSNLVFVKRAGQELPGVAEGHGGSFYQLKRPQLIFEGKLYPNAPLVSMKTATFGGSNGQMAPELRPFWASVPPTAPRGAQPKRAEVGAAEARGAPRAGGEDGPGAGDGFGGRKPGWSFGVQLSRMIIIYAFPPPPPPVFSSFKCPVCPSVQA